MGNSSQKSLLWGVEDATFQEKWSNRGAKGRRLTDSRAPQIDQWASLLRGSIPTLKPRRLRKEPLRVSVDELIDLFSGMSAAPQF